MAWQEGLKGGCPRGANRTYGSLCVLQQLALCLQCKGDNHVTRGDTSWEGYAWRMLTYVCEKKNMPKEALKLAE